MYNGKQCRGNGGKICGKSGLRVLGKREDVNEKREDRSQNEKTQLKWKPHSHEAKAGNFFLLNLREGSSQKKKKKEEESATPKKAFLFLCFFQPLP